MAKLKRLIFQIPVWSRVFFCLFPIAVLIHMLFIISGSFAEVYCRTVGHGFRSLLASITNVFPRSVAEIALISLPVIFVIIVVVILRSDGKSGTEVRVVSGMMSVVTLVYSLFVFTFAAGFYTRDIGEYFGIERRDITLDELYEAAVITAEAVNDAYGCISGGDADSTSMSMSVDEMNSEILKGFDSLYGEYGYPMKLKSRVKPVILSEPMTYTHISGVYTFFSGEANINVNYPDFVIPYTAAHELSHQRGISREDEANFAAFLVCIAADDPYVRYSGYLNMYEYMASAVASVSIEKYKELYGMFDDGVKRELISYSNFFDKYRDSVASKVSDKVNDSYLSVMAGTDSRSYGMVVDLATLYLISEN